MRRGLEAATDGILAVDLIGCCRIGRSFVDVLMAAELESGGTRIDIVSPCLHRKMR